MNSQPINQYASLLCFWPFPPFFFLFLAASWPMFSIFLTTKKKKQNKKTKNKTKQKQKQNGQTNKKELITKSHAANLISHSRFLRHSSTFFFLASRCGFYVDLICLI